MRCRMAGSYGLPPITCTLPALDRTMPRIALMNVVFPAPLAPINPKELPVGTARSTPASASCRVRAKSPLYVFFKPSVSIANTAAPRDNVSR